MVKKRGVYSNKKEISHIDELRTQDYRVFYAAPYFSLDLEYEIKWHRKHLKRLDKHSEKPHLFYKQFTNGKINEQRRQHFREHVIDSIPFHRRIHGEHEKRLEAISGMIPNRKYKKLVSISRRHGGTPEFFVYDKKNKDFFFVAEHINEAKRHWIHLVRDVHKICDVIVIR